MFFRSINYRRIALTSLFCLALIDHTFGFGRSTNDRAQLHNKLARVIRLVDEMTLELELNGVNGGHVPVRLCGLAVDNQNPDITTEQFLMPLVNQSCRLILDDRRPPRDAEGVLVAYLWRDDGMMLNEELLRLGLAKADREMRYALKLRFIRQEESARRRGDGMWAENRGLRRRR